MSVTHQRRDSREGQPLQGVFSVKRVTYTNPENGFAVVHLVPADRATASGIVATGIFGSPKVGDCYRIEGVWQRDPRHGMQVSSSSVTPEMPRNLVAIERYLAGASIKGLGPHYAKRLVDHFGEETFYMLQSGGGRLEEVSGIGPVRAQMIRDSWAEHQGVHDLMVKLQGVAGLSAQRAQHIYRQYGRESWAVISSQPYRLAEEVRGFGFRTCDRIAQGMGIALDDPARVQAAIIYLLREALSEGHLWCSPEQLKSQAVELLSAPAAVQPQIAVLVEQGRAVLEEMTQGAAVRECAYLPQVARTEQRIAERLALLLRRPSAHGLGLAPLQAEELVARVGDRSLTEEQREAITSLLCGARISILTGGPGTGKTTTVRSLIACLEALQLSFALCATTGRASKQLAQSTEREASTVHRHLRIGFGPQEIDSLKETVLIIDESSMIDLWLLDDILARTDNTHLVLVGDVDQLPSVGPGAVLQDLIEAAEEGVAGLHVSRLTHIFRQEAGAESLIVANCHRVRAGKRPIQPSDQGSDYYEMIRATPEDARDLAVSLATTRLPQYLDVPASEVQVLSPMHGGAAGVRALNAALQEVLNPSAPDKAEWAPSGDEQGRVLRVGDKVRQMRNDYQKGVLNGDLGQITQIEPEDKTVTVRFYEREIQYSADEVEALAHAWAMTVHAAQGSQWPAVVLILLTNHYVMLERNILYTALSRATRLAVLITQDRAVRAAVSQDRSTRRRTSLLPRLRQAMVTPLSDLARAPRANRLFD